MLSGVRVLDLTDEAGWLAGKILGDLGADVVKLEPPGGDPGRRAPFLAGIEDPERSLPWLALNTSKRSLVLDLSTSAGRESARDWIARVDVVLESAAPGHWSERGLDFEVLRRENPGLVWCAITPFGQTGPRAGWRARDLVVVAMGGNALLTGDPERPPVRCSMPTAYMHAAPEAALGVVMALHAREQSGRGQLVDVSMHECQLQTLLSAPGQYARSGHLGRRAGARLGRTREIWAAKDGWVTFGLRAGAARIPNLKATVAYMHECGMAPRWLREFDWDAYNPAEIGTDLLARLEDAFAAFFRSKTMRELYEEALRRRILLAPCNDAREIVEHVQLRARELFTAIDYPELGASLEHPAFFARTDPGGVSVRSRAPRVGEHDAAVGAWLDEPRGRAGSVGARAPGPDVYRGLKILELGAGAASPVASRYFAEQGATVLRVESARRPDFLRMLHWTARERDPDLAPMFVLLNPDKRSVTLDLKRPEAVRLVERLAGWADVVSENFSPGVMDRFGLGWDRLRAVNPRLVMVSGCLFGQTGPQRSYPGFGGQGAAIAGFNHLTGWPDGEAVGPYATITDSLAPRYVALLIAAALRERTRTGRGRFIDVSQIETGVYSLSEMIVRYSGNGEVLVRAGNRSVHAAPHGIYPCEGPDRWIAIDVRTAEQWDALVSELGRPGWATDPALRSLDARLARQEALDEQLAGWTRGQDRDALAERLQAAGVAAGPVQDLEDLLRDPQLAHRGHFVRLEHAKLGELPFERSGLRLVESPGAVRRPGPLLGQDNDWTLGEVLGLAEDEIARLVADGIVG